MMNKWLFVFGLLTFLVIAEGCTTSQDRVSGKSWSQIDARADRAQQRNVSPEDDWTVAH